MKFLTHSLAQDLSLNLFPFSLIRLAQTFVILRHIWKQRGLENRTRFFKSPRVMYFSPFFLVGVFFLSQPITRKENRVRQQKLHRILRRNVFLTYKKMESSPQNCPPKVQNNTRPVSLRPKSSPGPQTLGEWAFLESQPGQQNGINDEMYHSQKVFCKRRKDFSQFQEKSLLKASWQRTTCSFKSFGN